MANDSVDYLIVGGGIIGLLAARQLRKSGASVLVSDAGYPSASASAAGVLSALPPWLADSRVNKLIDMSERRLFGLLQEIQEEGVSCEWRNLGMLSLGYPTQKENGVYATVRALAPHFKTNKVRGFWMAEVAQLQPSRLLFGLQTVLKKQGVRFVQGVGQWELDDKKEAIRSWRLADGTALSAGAYVLCAGAHSGLLCPPPKPPLKPFRGQLLLYRNCKPQICIVLSEDGMYFVPRKDGALVVGASFEDVGFDNRTAAAVTADLHRRAVDLLPNLASAQLVNTWSGLRPCTPNGVPIIDKHPRYHNLFLNIGHSRYGVSMADASAQHLQKIINEKPKDNPYAFYESLKKDAQNWQEEQIL